MGKPVLTLLNSAFNQADARYNQNSLASSTGRLYDSDLNQETGGIRDYDVSVLAAPSAGPLTPVESCP